MRKNRKILLIVFFIFIILLLVSIFFFFMKSKSGNNINDKNLHITDTNGNTNLQTGDIEQKEIAKVQIVNSNGWNSGNKNYKQYNIIVENISDSVIENWRLEVSIDEYIEISQFWSGSYSINNEVLIINPVGYNTQIQSNEKVELGFIAESEENIDINNYKLYLNNSEIACLEYSNNINDSKENKINERIMHNKIERNVLIKVIKKGARNISKNSTNGDTPVELHRRLSVSGTNIVDYKGEIVQLRGVSTHSIYEYPEYINIDTFKELRDVWGINVIRIAMYSNPNDGYSSDLHEKVKEAVNYASELGLYVIIDWHILQDNDPNIYKNEAISFFKEMATEFKKNENIIYEICNEPNGTNVTWANSIKPYAEEVISEIRKIDENSIIIVGTPSWSKDVDIVVDSKIEEYSNIVYALHFYADSHKEGLRNKLKKAIEKGLPVFVSEFGISSADGNGNANTTEGDIWIDLLNEYSISWVCWNLSNKNESSALLKNTCEKLFDFEYDDFSQEGIWLLEKLRNNEE